jgi:hypothetical protein
VTVDDETAIGIQHSKKEFRKAAAAAEQAAIVAAQFGTPRHDDTMVLRRVDRRCIY